MSKRFKQVNVQQFAILVQEIDISKYTQEEYVDVVEEIYMTIFRHNTDGEYVIDAETVAMLGDGSNRAGADKLDGFRENVRMHKGGNLTKGKFSKDAKSPLEYMRGIA